jgi:uncharacterized protein (TIGR02246 family)
MGKTDMLAAALVLAVVTAACQPPAQEAAGLFDEDIAVLKAREEQEWPQALLAGDAAAAAGMHAEDAVRLGSNEPLLKGRANIQASLEEWFSMFDVTEFTQTVEDIDARGDLAYVRGSARSVKTRLDTGELIADQGKYVAIMRGQSDGSWLTDIAIWNSDLPVAEHSAESEM